MVAHLSNQTALLFHTCMWKENLTNDEKGIVKNIIQLEAEPYTRQNTKASRL